MRAAITIVIKTDASAASERGLSQNLLSSSGAAATQLRNGTGTQCMEWVVKSFPRVADTETLG